MFVTLLIWALIGLLVAFVIAGFVVFAQAIADARKTASPTRVRLSLRDRARRYVGPVRPDMALLRPHSRVALEMLAALCGFPGLGWLASGRVIAGLVLLTLGPAFVWAIYPLYLSYRGFSSPLEPVLYLPALALTSAGALAFLELGAARRRRHHDA